MYPHSVAFRLRSCGRRAAASGLLVTEPVSLPWEVCGCEGSNGGGNAGGKPAAAAVLAPEEARVTGEETERAAFSGEGVLYEFGEARARNRQICRICPAPHPLTRRPHH